MTSDDDMATPPDLPGRGLHDVLAGRPRLTFVREFGDGTTPETVWEHVATPEGLSRWFPCTARFRGEHGEPISFEVASDLHLEGEVRDFEPPSRFSFLWGTELCRIELAATGAGGGGTQLTFTHVLSGGADTVARTAAGWHVCLDALELQVRGGSGAGAGAGDATDAEAGLTEAWQSRYDAYVALGYPYGAEIPGTGVAAE